MSKTTRDECRPIIARVLKENEGKPENEIRKALRDAFPWPPRKYHPYKIWLDEIRVQMGKRKFKAKKQKPVAPNQTNMFDDDPDLYTGGFDL
jgi:hypothetical protein